MREGYHGMIRSVEKNTPLYELNERCPICNGMLIERKLKKHCTVCGVLCETCCDGGKE